MSFTVLKADGSSEYFKVEKLRRSLRRSGASNAEIARITEAVIARLYDGVKTQEIYRIAFELLRASAEPAAARYSLRRALFGLGPTGFPFERYLARLFMAEGYTTKTGLIVRGHCAPHEIDVAAYKSDHSFVAEAKFHARPGTKTDLQVVMYAYARLLDLREARVCSDDICGIREFWLITNTKFTTTAEKYGECAGIAMLSWDYPRHNNLHDRIQRLAIYPISVLHTLTQAQIVTLLGNDVILCNDIVAKPHVLRHLHLSESKLNEVLNEAKAICAAVSISR